MGAVRQCDVIDKYVFTCFGACTSYGHASLKMPRPELVCFAKLTVSARRHSGAGAARRCSAIVGARARRPVVAGAFAKGTQ